jgi:manganese transport protein
MGALFINSAILIVAAVAFHRTGHHEIAEIQDAYKMLSPMLGVGVAGTVFALALLASGQNSTLTGTLAGQIVMEGFFNLRLRPWVSRLLTRLTAILPAVICIAIYGDSGATKLLVLSQVILSLQLPFAVIPLVQFTSERAKMGEFANPWWLKAMAWFVAGVIVILNVKYLLDFIGVTAWLTKVFS